MPNKRRAYTREQHWKSIRCYKGLWRTLAICFVLAFVAVSAWHVYVVIQTDAQYDAEVRVVAALDMRQPADRIVMASTMIQLHGYGVGPSALDDQSFLNMVDYVSATGEPAWITSGPGSWHDYTHRAVPRLFSMGLAIISTVLAMAYAEESKRHKYYLADLPWCKPWVWQFVALAPLLWTLMVVSAVRMRRNPPQEVVKKTPKTFSFQTDLDGARTQYCSMRRANHETSIQRFKEVSDKELAALLEECTELGEALRETQTKRLRLQAEVARFDALDPTELAAPDADVLVAEFNRLRQLPGVCGVRPFQEDSIEILVEATTVYEDVRYNLGTWGVFLDSGSVGAHELASGVRPDWSGREPAYRLSKKFCFGDSESVINAHLAKGQLLEAATLAVHQLSFVNEADRHNIPKAFKEVRGGSE